MATSICWTCASFCASNCRLERLKVLVFELDKQLVFLDLISLLERQPPDRRRHLGADPHLLQWLDFPRRRHRFDEIPHRSRFDLHNDRLNGCRARETRDNPKDDTQRYAERENDRNCDFQPDNPRFAQKPGARAPDT